MTEQEVERRIRSGPLIMFARRAGVFTIGLVTTTVAAHLIPPRAFGLATMSTLVFSLAELFKDCGLSSALMRKGSICAEEVNFIFWLNAAATLLLSAVLAAAAPWIAQFFHEPTVLPVMLASLIGFIAGGLALQPRAMMMREFRFAELTAIDLGALVLQLAVTLAAALVRRDVWAIVLGSTAGSLATAFGVFLRVGWRPGRPALIAEAPALLRFGAHTTLFSLSVYLSNNLGPLLIGRLFGSALLGQYNRGQSFYVIAIRNAAEPLLQSYMPVLARLRTAPERYRETYLDLVRRITVFTAPGAVLLTFAAEPLMEVMLGQRWRGAGEVLAALAPGIAVFGLTYPATDLFITQDRTSELAVLSLVELLLRGALVAGAARFGIVPCAMAFTVGSLLTAGVRTAVAGSRGPVDARAQLLAASAAAPAMLGCGLGCLGALSIEALHPMTAAFGVACTLAMGGSGALVGLLAFRPGRETLREFTGRLRQTLSQPWGALRRLTPNS